MHVPHFEEPGCLNRDLSFSANGWIPDELYATVLDTIVVTCVDIFLMHQGKILLGQRNRYPRRGWWIVGGRMIAGESPVNAVQRKVAEEAGLTIERSRIQWFGVYSTSFATRHQPPIENGLHSVNLAHLVHLTNEEKAQIVLTSREYETWTWVAQDETSQLLNLNQDVDRALEQMLLDCWRAIGQVT